MPEVQVEPFSEATWRAIGEGLRAHNVAFGGAPKRQDEFAATLRSKDGLIVGGITCDLYLGGMHIEWAWVEESLRGQGYGSALLQAVEQHGRQKGAAFVHLDTFMFQAQAFYERHGYAVFGTLKYPHGLERFYMRKVLVS